MKYKHALFLNPYTLTNSSRDVIRGLFPPTGLEYVATSAKDFAEKITLIDLRYEKSMRDTNRLLDFISEEIDIIGVSVGWNRQFNEIRDLLNLMPDNIPLVIGGYKATESAEELFETCPKIDIIVRGEGEETIKEILKDEPSENVMGISYRKNNKVIHNRNRPLPDVNTITFPDRALRGAEYRMMLNGVNVTNFTFDTVLSARGCPYNCKFCTFNLNPIGQKRYYSARNPESVIEEIEKVSADVVLFSDDNFFTNMKRAEEICDLIIDRKIKRHFIAQARIEISNNPGLLEKMIKAGFKMLLIGIESPHDRILMQLNKGFDSQAIKKSFTLLRKYPIYYHGYFIYGNIGETEEEMLCIPKFAKDIGVDSITYSKLRMDKFSPLRDVAKNTPGYYITKDGSVYSDTCTQALLEKVGRRIKFYFYTPSKILSIFHKFLSIKILSLKTVFHFFITTPLLLKNIIVRQLQKGRLGDSLKRIFISNN